LFKIQCLDVDFIGWFISGSSLDNLRSFSRASQTFPITAHVVQSTHQLIRAKYAAVETPS